MIIAITATVARITWSTGNSLPCLFTRHNLVVPSFGGVVGVTVDLIVFVVVFDLVVVVDVVVVVVVVDLVAVE